jgi:hypothetical protein
VSSAVSRIKPFFSSILEVAPAVWTEYSIP